MKLFLRTAKTAGTAISCAIATALLCCGCGDIGAQRGAEEYPGAGQGDGGHADKAMHTAAEPWQYADTAMGTVVQQTIYTKDEETAEDFAEQAMEVLRRLEREQISWRLDTSEVYRANTYAGSQEGFLLSEELSVLLESCQLLWERSDGAFDVTLGAAIRLWDIDKWAAGEAVEDFAPPSEEELARALATCGSQRMRLVEDAAMDALSAESDGSGEGRLPMPEQPEGTRDAESGAPAEDSAAVKGPLRLFLPEGMQLDLGAVGKGLAMEELGGLLAERPDVTGAVISLGGSILTYGGKPDGSPWRVGIVDPFDTSDSIGILTLEGQWCISTSGDYERYVELDGIRYHHILDPKTGAPARSDVRGVTVLMKDGLLDDGLSTACYILGPEKGMALAGQYGAEALFVMADGGLEMSDGMRQYFTENKDR